MAANEGKFFATYGTVIHGATEVAAGGCKEKQEVYNPDKAMNKKDSKTYWQFFLIPYTCFFFCSYSYAFVRFQSPSAGDFLIAMCVSIFVWTVLQYRKTLDGQDILRGKLLVQFTLSGIVFGGFFGWIIFTYFFHASFATAAAQHYVNAIPSSPAGGFADAGEISFSVETRIDASRGVGFASAGGVYCLAPVVDQPIDKNIQFFAIGEDCCGARGGFACNAGLIPNDSDGHQKVAKVELFPDAVWFKALSLALAENGMTAAEKPLFVRFMPDVQAYLQSQYFTGVVLYSLGAILWFLVCHQNAASFTAMAK